MTVSSPTKLALTGDSAGWARHSQSLVTRALSSPSFYWPSPATVCLCHKEGVTSSRLTQRSSLDQLQPGHKGLLTTIPPCPPGPLWLPKFPRFPTCYVLDLPCSFWASLPTALASFCILANLFIYLFIYPGSLTGPLP